MFEKLRVLWERRFIRIVAYLAFGVASFFLFLVMTFPENRVRQIVSNEIEAQTDFEYDVNIERMRFWRLTGISMQGITLRERTSLDDEGLPMTARIERISGRLAPLRSILGGGPAVHFQIDVGESIIRGRFQQQGLAANSDQILSLTMDELDLRQSTLLNSLTGMPIFGVLDGEVELHLDGARGGMITGGHVDLTGRQLTLGSTIIESEQIPIFTELELPTTSFGNMEMKLRFEETERGSRLVFEEFKTQGRDIMTEAWGQIDFFPGSGGRPRIELRLQVNEEYVTEHDLAMLFNMNEFRQGEYGEWYGFVIAGRSGDINFRGSRTAAQGPSDPVAPAGDGDGDGDGDEVPQE